MKTTRRAFLSRTLALGCSAAASPLMTPVTLAATPGDHRLVVIILRGAMDGLDVVRPTGDPAFAALRPDTTEGLPLDDRFTLHPALAPIHDLWRSGELAFAHAVSTPYRDKRSHFDGQDLLETGGTDLSKDDGWLNRALSALPNSRAETAFAVGRERLLLLTGEHPVNSWSPDSTLNLSPQAQLLLQWLYDRDPLFKETAERAMALSDLTDTNVNARRASRARALAEFTAGRLRADARIAAFSITGWDTHVRQDTTLPRALQELSDALLTLKTGLGPDWEHTAVLCLTEFGRTVRLNGSRGTDHGTGGLALMAGGAIKGGRVMGTWPGLGTLYQDRDLVPTEDVRRYAAWALHDLFNIDISTLSTRVFPGLDMQASPKLLA